MHTLSLFLRHYWPALAFLAIVGGAGLLAAMSSNAVDDDEV